MGCLLGKPKAVAVGSSARPCPVASRAPAMSHREAGAPSDVGQRDLVFRRLHRLSQTQERSWQKRLPSGASVHKRTFIR